MNIKYITISMVAAAILFTACGGGGDTTKGDDTPTESAVSIQNSVKSFKAVAGERKYVSMSTGKDIITAGEPNSLFSVVSDGGADASFDALRDGNNYGILKFESSTPGTYDVIINVKNSAGTSEDETFTFEVVSKSDAEGTASQPVLATSRTDYTRNIDTQYNVQDDSTALVWNDNDDVSSIINSTYASAQEKCTGDWRLPTLNELFDITDYGKSYLGEGEMLPDTFEKKTRYMWVEEKNGKNYYVNSGTGMTFVDTAGQQLSYRCVKGDKYEQSHLVSTEVATGATYDYTSGLKWSRASYVTGETGAAEYCDGTLHEESGWRLPTINELRSMVEDSIVPSSIVTISAGGQHLSLVSSTVSNDSTDEAQPMHYGLLLFWDRSEPWVTRFFDSGENANYSATCVKEF